VKRATLALGGAELALPTHKTRNHAREETEMSHTKNVLKVFGICLAAVFGLMAVSAAGAQAQTGWLVNGAFITATKTIEAEIHPLKATAPEERHMVLTGEALKSKVSKLCEKLVVDDGLLFGEAANRANTEGLAKLLFSNCKTFLNGVESAVCKPVEPITAEVLFRAILHNSLTYILFEPEPGKPLVTIQLTAPCVLAPGQDVAGTVVMECLTEKLESMEEAAGKPDLCLSDLVNHLLREAPNQKLFGANEGLTFGGKAAKLEGIILVKIAKTDADSGKTWACHI
jgi:hypothetical protein